MDLQDITKDVVNRQNFRISRQLEDLIRINPRYRHLDESNRKIILDLVMGYKEKVRRGIRPSRVTIREDKYYLYQNRFKLKLSPQDLSVINKLLDSFKS